MRSRLFESVRLRLRAEHSLPVILRRQQLRRRLLRESVHGWKRHGEDQRE